MGFAVLAKDLKVGDYVPVSEQHGNGTLKIGASVLARVTFVRKRHLSHHNFLVTDVGTVVANGVVSTTICNVVPTMFPGQNLSQLVDVWQQHHHFEPQVLV